MNDGITIIIYTNLLARISLDIEYEKRINRILYIYITYSILSETQNPFIKQ